jgi:hypothetical protein
MILVAVRELAFRSRIQEAAARCAVPIRLAPRDRALDEVVREAGARVLLVDLTQPGVLDEIRAAKRGGPLHVVGFLGHLQTDLMEEAAAAGVDEVLPRGQFARRIDDLLRGADGPASRRSAPDRAP